MTSRSELRRLAVQAGEPMPEFGPQDRTGEANRSASPVPESAPGHNPPVPGAASGTLEPSQVRSRATAAQPGSGGRGTPSHTPVREGEAAPGTRMPGAAGTSAPVRAGSGAEREQPGGIITPAAGLPPAQSPPGTGSGAAATVPGGSTPLAGQDARAAWKAAESANAKAKRNGRGRYPVKRRGDGYAPGMTRRMPPGGGAA
jgi:hypothetical protein